MEWINTKEKLPNNNNEVLILVEGWDDMFSYQIAFYENDGLQWSWCITNGDVLTPDKVKYWQELPNLPK